MKKILMLSLLAFLFTQDFWSQTLDPKISDVINSVSIDSLIENIKYLTGEKAVLISGDSQYITSRAYQSIGNFYSEEYLQQRFKQYKLNTSLQTFSGGGGNVIGIQLGKIKPNKQIIICAHFDSRPYSGPAPGADDNASGTSAVLEAARILSKLKTDYTIIYALWDHEELNLLGSGYYAQQAKSKNDSIIAVINMDMIGWDSNNDYLAEIHTRDINSSNQIGGKIISVNSLYSVGLNLAVINPGSTSSDHSSFWNSGYPAIMIIENYSLMNGVRDFNANYHTSSDGLQYINKNFFERCAKVSIGALASYAGIQSTTSVKESIVSKFKLNQNYPNPFNPVTTISYSIDKSTQVKLVIVDVLGKEITTLINDYKIPGKYDVTFDASNYGELTSGVYFYVMYSGDYVDVKKMVLIK